MEVDDDGGYAAPEPELLAGSRLVETPKELIMHRVARSRRHLADLLRRRPILDSVVAGPHGPPGQLPEDHVPTILEKVNAAPAVEDDNDSRHRAPAATASDERGDCFGSGTAPSLRSNPRK